MPIVAMPTIRFGLAISRMSGSSAGSWMVAATCASSRNSIGALKTP